MRYPASSGAGESRQPPPTSPEVAPSVTPVPNPVESGIRKGLTPAEAATRAANDKLISDFVALTSTLLVGVGAGFVIGKIDKRKGS